MGLLFVVLLYLWVNACADQDEVVRKKIAEMESEMEGIKQALRGSSPSWPSQASATFATANASRPTSSFDPPSETFWNNRPGDPRVFFFTFMDKLSNYGCASLRSAMMSGTNVTVFGLSSTLHRANGDRYHGFGYKGDKIKKVFIMHKYLELLYSAKDYRDDDIILFNDGFDVLYTPSLGARFVEAFKSIEAPNTAIFAGERTCWPDNCEELNVTSTFKYVNSGNYVARFPVALRLLRTWVEVMRLEGDEAEDQTAVHQMIRGHGKNSKTGRFDMKTVFETLKGKDSSFSPVDIKLDTQCIVFQTGMRTKLSDGTWKDAPTPEQQGFSQGPYLRVQDGVIYNTETKTLPLLIHFNGERAWFMPVEKIFHDRFVFNDSTSNSGSREYFRKACVRYLQLYSNMHECSKLLSVDSYCE